ncbi:M48 family metalloprotease [Hymenobacter cavernae]|uniref:Peptidase M48 domain-containing protein n=1 Tax=Hymenobacter cavernae TaxID=2044852 RepID=A0ABQ1U4S1_9BACT|nr:M48 family metalloprotease [Hymenobacter cavernae]GGF09199.1 hypothetical protein GCM10011383_20490 [Hymenobacter cavernae]
MKRPFLQVSLFLSLGALAATGAAHPPYQGFSLLSIETDKTLGAQVAAQTDSTYRAKGQLLDRNSKNARAYQLLDAVVNRVLNSGQITYRKDFPWDVKIIKDDATQNAFATPGGHIYVYSGLIKYLDSEDQLAGVIGHEIAHADRRHSVKSLQKQMGVSILMSLVLGQNPNQLAQIAAGLGQLKFSRDYEREADNYSVAYLKGTNYYSCDGTAGFFIKAEKAGQSNPPEFLSTHPNPGARISSIQARAKQLGCTGRSSSSTNLTELKKLL